MPEVGELVTQPSTLPWSLKAEKFTTCIEKRHRRGPWRGASLWASMGTRQRVVPLKSGGLVSGAPYAEENHRPSLAATERAARLRRRGEAWQLHRGCQRAADLAERTFSPRHRARAAHRRAALRAAAARAHP